MVGRGSQSGGGTGAARQFFFRHRVLLFSIVLSVLGIVTGAATTIAFLQGASPREAALICAGALLAGGCAMLQTRHLGLAFLVAAAPLPGLAWVAPVSGDAAFDAVPILAYAFGFAVAAMQAQNILLRTLDGSEAEHPGRSAAAALGLMAALALLWFWKSEAGAAAFQAVLDTGFAAASVLLILPIGATFLHFDENFVAEANRARERRQRVLEKFAMVAVPRWGTSIAGIALVFLALAWFGAEPASPHVSPAIVAASAGLVFLVANTLGGGWREGLAALAVAALVALMALWGSAVAGKASSVEPVAVAELVALAMVLVFYGARRARFHRQQGDDPAIARLRAVEETGGPQIFATLSAAAALLPSLVVHPGEAPFVVALLFAGAGGLGFAPAIVTALESFLPRRRSVEELYGRR